MDTEIYKIKNSTKNTKIKKKIKINNAKNKEV